MTQVIFTYNQNQTIIQCCTQDKMKDITDKFISKIGISKDSINFLYSGTIINEELTLEETIGTTNKYSDKINILVYEKEREKHNAEVLVKSDNVICPECGEIAILQIKDYKINIFGCKNEHKINHIFLKDFENTQNINISKIICNKCKESNKGNTFKNKFYECINYKMNLCPLCQNSHDTNHMIIDYEQKDFICNEHNESYNRFCKICNENICISCEPQHENHNTIRIIPNLDNIRNKRKYKYI